MTRTIYISTDPTGCGHKFWFPLYIYPTGAELVAAARKYAGTEQGFWDGCYGCFHPRCCWKYDRKGNAVRTPRTSFIGVMRLTTEHLDHGVIIHESTHAAISLVNGLRLRHGFKLGDSNIESEESLCYTVQEISTAIMKHLVGMGE